MFHSPAEKESVVKKKLKRMKRNCYALLLALELRLELVLLLGRLEAVVRTDKEKVEAYLRVMPKNCKIKSLSLWEKMLHGKAGGAKMMIGWP